MYEPHFPLPFCLADSAIITSLLLTITWEYMCCELAFLPSQLVHFREDAHTGCIIHNLHDNLHSAILSPYHSNWNAPCSTRLFIQFLLVLHLRRSYREFIIIYMSNWRNNSGPNLLHNERLLLLFTIFARCYGILCQISRWWVKCRLATRIFMDAIDSEYVRDAGLIAQPKQFPGWCTTYPLSKMLLTWWFRLTEFWPYYSHLCTEKWEND